MDNILPNNLPINIWLYCQIKISISPIVMLNELTPFSGHVLDVGCGYGLGTWILGKNKPDLLVEGIDIDPEKIDVARKYFDLVNFKYWVKDIHEFDSDEKFDAIVVSDIFYLVPYEKQEMFIAKITTMLNDKGRFILKDMDTTPKWKYYVNMLQELIAVRITGFTWGSKFYFRSSHDYKRLFEKYGMSWEKIEIKGYCYPHIYFIGKRSEGS